MNYQDEDDAFKRAYNASKSRYPVPSRIKRKIDAEAQGNWQQYVPRKEWLAFACALVCVFFIYAIVEIPTLTSPHVNPVTVTVEYHGYDDDFSQSPSHQEQLTVYSKEYAQQLQNIQSFYSKTAYLTKTATNWQFIKCDNQRIEVSKNLLTDLRQLQKAPVELASGSFVELSFDKEGRLIAIMPSNKTLC